MTIIVVIVLAVLPVLPLLLSPLPGALLGSIGCYYFAF